MGDIAGSLAILDYLISAFEGSSDIEIRTSVAWAMLNKGWDMILQDRFEEAVSLYEDFFDSVPFQPPFLLPVAKGLMNSATALDRLGRHAEEMAIYDRIANGLESPTTEAELHLLAWSFINKAITLSEGESYTEAIEQCDEVLSRWWSLSDWNTSTNVREFLAAAIRHRANAMVAKGEYRGAIADVDRLLKRYLWSNEAGLRIEVAWAMLSKAASFEFLKLPTESKATYEAVVRRFNRSRDQQVQEAVAKARQRLEELNRERLATAPAER